MIEHVLNDIAVDFKVGPPPMLNLDTGEELTPPDGMHEFDQAKGWAQAHGADIIACRDGGGRGLRIIDGLAIQPASWDASAKEVVEAISNTESGLESYKNAIPGFQDPREPGFANLWVSDKDKTTFFIKTRGGSIGILQITEAIDGPTNFIPQPVTPHRILFRYKLLRPATPKHEKLDGTGGIHTDLGKEKPVADTVLQFNTRAEWDPIGKDQPPLTEDELRGAIYSLAHAENDRFSTDEKQELEKAAAIGVLPKDWQLEVFTKIGGALGERFQGWMIYLSRQRRPIRSRVSSSGSSCSLCSTRTAIPRRFRLRENLTRPMTAPRRWRRQSMALTPPTTRLGTSGRSRSRRKKWWPQFAGGKRTATMRRSPTVSSPSSRKLPTPASCPREPNLKSSPISSTATARNISFGRCASKCRGNRSPAGRMPTKSAGSTFIPRGSTTSNAKRNPSPGDRSADKRTTSRCTLEPHDETYATGQQVTPIFYYRNAGKAAIQPAFPRLMTHSYYKKVIAVDKDGKPIAIDQDPNPTGPVGWIEEPLRPGAQHEIKGLPIMLGDVDRGAAETVIRAEAGQSLRIHFELSNVARTTRPDCRPAMCCFRWPARRPHLNWPNRRTSQCHRQRQLPM